jgi:hypothetical protein
VGTGILFDNILSCPICPETRYNFEPIDDFLFKGISPFAGGFRRWASILPGHCLFCQAGEASGNLSRNILSLPYHPAHIPHHPESQRNIITVSSCPGGYFQAVIKFCPYEKDK